MKKKTLKKEIELEGVGIHSGQYINLSLKPSESGHIEFIRRDRGVERYGLDAKKVESDFCTSLEAGNLKVKTLEHLLAVLFIFGIDSVVIELDGEEIPIMDGSALPFVVAVQEAGARVLQQEKRSVRITRPFHIQEGEGSVDAAPSPEFRVSYRIAYDHPAIREQEISLSIDRSSFVEAVAPARTFGFADEVLSLHARGLALGGSLENAIVLNREGVINGPLRFPDEFVRHKVLDFLGDLALFGSPIIGHFKGNKAGHRLHNACVQFLSDNPDFWEPF